MEEIDEIRKLTDEQLNNLLKYYLFWDVANVDGLRDYSWTIHLLRHVMKERKQDG